MGDVMLLLKTLDKVAGLVKNARVRVVGVRWNAVTVALPRARCCGSAPVQAYTTPLTLCTFL